MNALLLGGMALLGLVLGYAFYSRKVSAWIGLSHKITPPAVEFEDGVDYVPAKHWMILFGHHFASIAGAAPIIGPVIACLVWGWGPALVWIVVGSVFFGAVHDYFALASSVENKGRSVNALSETVLGKSAKVIFSLFVFLALILIVAVFAAVAGKTLANTPTVVIPTFGLIVVAIGVGLLVYQTNLPLLVDTLVGLALLAGLIWLGYHVPFHVGVAEGGHWWQPMFQVGGEGFEMAPEQLAEVAKFWTVVLLVYGLIASVLPVSLLLQPRDHLAAGVLFFGMFFGFLGVIIARPEVHSPSFVDFKGGPGWLWPMMFVTIACGAISGFHSLVSSGTTSKQLPEVAHARPIGYGAMIMEGALAVLAVLAVSAGLYWTKDQIPAGVEGHVYKEAFAGGNWIKAFGLGYGQLTGSIFGALGTLIGITMLKTFVMTTLDSATRITRYITAELFGETFGIKPLKNRFLTTALIGVCAGSLALGNWQAIWPIFGSANQLIAALVLILATAYLITRGRSWVFTAVPAALVLVTALGALVYKFWEFVSAEEPKYMLAGVAVLLFCLGGFVTVRGVIAIIAAGRKGPGGPGGEGIAEDRAEPAAQNPMAGSEFSVD